MFKSQTGCQDPEAGGGESAVCQTVRVARGVHAGRHQHERGAAPEAAEAEGAEQVLLRVGQQAGRRGGGGGGGGIAESCHHGVKMMA